MFLFLDDERMPHDIKWAKLPVIYNWEIVRNYNEFVEYVTTNGVPKFVHSITILQIFTIKLC